MLGWEYEQLSFPPIAGMALPKPAFRYFRVTYWPPKMVLDSCIWQKVHLVAMTFGTFGCRHMCGGVFVKMKKAGIACGVARKYPSSSWERNTCAKIGAFVLHISSYGSSWISDGEKLPGEDENLPEYKTQIDHLPWSWKNENKGALSVEKYEHTYHIAARNWQTVLYLSDLA